ncbi:hypothetical protein F442_00132 [Phytophthora nicotianae P10297]|uniref:Uncharacterized protein n=1 Tax=Phytophthora nicotianae P10297 TaxID=1317064 RepID=W3A806_PHYNI|nr:hypothetical protein F442_00132 [Phytophthora nicotianae P10297]
MQGKCTLKQCPCGDDNDVAVAACTSCKKPVHHMCFTITYEGRPREQARINLGLRPKDKPKEG